MWKELIISIVIVIIIIVGNIVTQNYTVSSIEELSNSLLELRTQLEKNEENIKEDDIKDKINKIEEDWHDKHRKFAYYIEHDELETVETDIVSLKSFIESNEYAEATSELDKCTFILKHIEEKYDFSLENIF